MWYLPASVTRKQSPNPTRYMRMLISGAEPPVGWLLRLPPCGFVFTISIPLMKSTKVDLACFHGFVGSTGDAFPRLLAEERLLLGTIVTQALANRVTQSSVFVEQQRHAAECRAASLLFGLFQALHNDCDHFRSGQERIGTGPNHKVE